jgi:regulator of sirC expression with transglutaminase-like and TPR domain
VTPVEAREELLRLLNLDARPFPMARAALLLAMDEYPHLDLREYDSRLDGYAGRVREQLPGDCGDPRTRLAALRRVLFEEEGFHGNREQYYDVRNSYLNEVLDRKLGIPISLGVLLLGVGGRLGWPLEGVNFPNHFLVRYATPGEALALDPFHGGLILGEEELAERWRLHTEDEPPPIDRMLEPAPPRHVVLRMLNNIWMVHAEQQRFGLAALAVEKCLLLDPSSRSYGRRLCEYRLRAEDYPGAAAALEEYLDRFPGDPDTQLLRQQLRMLQRHLAGGG